MLGQGHLSPQSVPTQVSCCPVSTRPGSLGQGLDRGGAGRTEARAPARHVQPWGSTFQAHPRAPPSPLPLSFLKETPPTGGAARHWEDPRNRVCEAWQLREPQPAPAGLPLGGPRTSPCPPHAASLQLSLRPHPHRARRKWPGPKMGPSPGEQREEEARTLTSPLPPCPSPGLWLRVSGSWAPPQQGSQGWFRGQGQQLAQPTGRAGRGLGEGSQRGKYWRPRPWPGSGPAPVAPKALAQGPRG